MKGVGRPAKCTRRPPRIVVREGDVRRIDSPDAAIAGRRTDVPGELDHLNGREIAPDGGRGSVAGGVVDDHDRRSLGKRRKLAEAVERPLEAVMDEHDYCYGGLGHT